MNSIGKLNSRGAAPAGAAVLTLMVAMTLPCSVCDQARSVASKVSGVNPLSANARPNLSRASASAGVACSTTSIFSAPGTLTSASRYSTPVSTSGAGSGSVGGATGVTGSAAVVSSVGVAGGFSGVLHPDSPSAATIVAALRAAMRVRSNYPTDDSRFRADPFEICQPVGLGPATNWMFWVAVPPVAAVAVTSA